MKPLLASGSVILVAVVFLFMAVPIPFWNDVLSLPGLFYPGLLALAALSFWLSRRNTGHDYMVAVVLVLVACGIIAVMSLLFSETSIIGTDVVTRFHPLKAVQT